MKRTLNEYVAHNADHYPDRTALTAGPESVTYASLWERVQARAAEHARSADKCVMLRASQDVGFVIEYLAVTLAGKVIVPVEHDLPAQAFDELHEVVRNADIPAEVTDILFTTGTTSRRKGTMLSQKAILSDAENLIDSQGFSHDLNFIIAGPLNHIGSLSKIWPCLMLGATITVLDGFKDMALFFKTIAESELKVATFLVPASIRMMLQFGSADLAKLAAHIDFIETGAAPISQSDMEALCRALPATRLYNTYASTETGIICTHDYNAGYCKAGCLGKVMKHSELSIDNDGLISCSGDTVMTGYVGDAETTAQVLRDGRVYTQDVGQWDEEGRLQLIGRKGDTINVGGFKINPVEVESAAMAFPGITDCICIPDKHPVLGTAMRLLYVADETIYKKALGKHLMSRLERHKVPQFFSQVEKVNRTFNGKLDRKSYLG